MIRQYFAQRHQGGDNPLRVGVIATGSIYYLQDQGYFRPYGDAAVCRDPWIVEGFLNGTVSAARRSPSTGRWEDVHYAGRSDMALVRSLRTGRRRQVAVRTLIVHDELGLTREPTRYPSLPDMRLYRRTATACSGKNRLSGVENGATGGRTGGWKGDGAGTARPPLTSRKACRTAREATPDATEAAIEPIWLLPTAEQPLHGA